MTLLGVLEIDRPATYRERARRYVVEIDGQTIKPSLQGNAKLTREVEPGEHRVRVSAGRDRFTELTVRVDAGETARLTLKPNGLLFVLGAPPLIVLR